MEVMRDAKVTNGMRGPKKTPLNFRAMRDRLVHNHHLRSRYVRLREQGYLTIAEVALREGMSCNEIWRRRKQGRLTGLPYGTNKYLYHPVPTVSCNQLTPEVAI